MRLLSSLAARLHEENYAVATAGDDEAGLLKASETVYNCIAPESGRTRMSAPYWSTTHAPSVTRWRHLPC
jgi:hypothetical protein